MNHYISYRSLADLANLVLFYVSKLYSPDFFDWEAYQNDRCEAIAHGSKLHSQKEFEPDVFRFHGKTYPLFDLWGLSCEHLLNNPDNKVMSQWDVRWIIWLFVAIAMYALLAVAVNLFSIRFVVTRLMRRDRFKDSNKWFLEKRSYIILAGSIITFGVIMAIFKTGMLTSSNFVKMSASMLLELSWSERTRQSCLS